MKKFGVLLLLFIIRSSLITPLYAQMEWICATNSASWSARSNHTSVVFNNKMWVIGGWDFYNHYYDVWYSTDGKTWTCACSSAAWSGRGYHTSVIFDNKIWVLGGWADGLFFNDVWYSPDGINWTCACSLPEWSVRADHSSEVKDNKIWVMGGGIDSSPYFDDVWYSTGLGIEEHSTSNKQYNKSNATIFGGVINLQAEISNLQSEVTLLDITGRKIADLKSGSNNIRYLAPGVYFIRRDDTNQVTKIIVTK